MGIKKDKLGSLSSVLYFYNPLFLNFSICSVVLFRTLSNFSLLKRAYDVCCFFLSFRCFFHKLRSCVTASSSFKKCGENVAYRMLSFTLTHIPIAAIAANRLIIIVISIFLKPFLSFFSILNHLHNHLSIPSFN